MHRQLFIMLKEPRPGRVKTRLGRDIGMVPAAWWFRHQSARLIRRLEDPRWQLTLAVSPDTEGLSSRVWPEHLHRVPQGAGDLGDRMARIFRSALPGPVLIIGADIPGIGKTHIARGFRALGAHDAVFGPAPDGGYWAVGLKRSSAQPPGLFKQVRWSSEYALADTMSAFGSARLARVDTLADIDTEADLKSEKHG
ncbi:TIGR04282 family arsenosugar biosynthesis glycosyltransferase [Aliiruegeria lutimaris]|uniref:2-phospho-L-lactate guanylyltransferase n=1 Tax=Aliiruegeria lutimaris TaxID=571298 RepID=A0A1G8VSL3_9RHOB|nr:TIGR04282 family arsenosugar biosynthesis glycosyltransferase [Aliiruegeria lutimaris]SDJ69006.1 hypothetical protein SAMN04488026_102223 [Aliiruegeria lutimaris]